MGPAHSTSLKSLVADLHRQEVKIQEGGGAEAIQRQHAKKRLTARERIAQLLDPGNELFELGLWAAWNMYTEWGGAPAAGVVTGIGTVAGRQVMVIANDATVKAGAFFPMTAKKVLRAQRIAMENRLPLIYLVDSAGVFLPLQDEVFPDEDDFGRIFRNNAVISAAGIDASESPDASALGCRLFQRRSTIARSTPMPVAMATNQPNIGHRMAKSAEAGSATSGAAGAREAG